MELVKEKEEVSYLERKTKDSRLELLLIMEEAGHLKDVLMKKRSFAANLKEEIDPAIREYFDNAIAQLSVGNPNLNLYHMALDRSDQGGRLCSFNAASGQWEPIIFCQGP